MARQHCSFLIQLLIISTMTFSFMENSFAILCSELFQNAVQTRKSLPDIPKRGFFLQFENVTVPHPQVSISVHTSRSFDHNSTTQNAVVALNSLVRSEGTAMPSISLVKQFQGSEPESNHYLAGSDIDIPIRSEAGGHKIQFTGLESAIFSGGYFGICFKNAFRNVIQGAINDSYRLDFYFVTDAIYESNISVGPIRQNLRSEYGQHGTSRSPQFPLKEALRFLPEDQIVSFLSSRLEIGYEDSQLSIGYRRDRDYTPGGITINFYGGNTLLGSVGNGAKEVNIFLVDLETLKPILKP